MTDQEFLNSMPRPEYPRPQFQRSDWINLNGPWSYECDFGLSGNHRELFKSTGFDGTIIVPFCPESELSGLTHHDFIPAIWYHRSITIPQAWDGRCVRIHCGGVDYETAIYIDGAFVGRHFGGDHVCRHTFPHAGRTDKHCMIETSIVLEGRIEANLYLLDNTLLTDDVCHR